MARNSIGLGTVIQALDRASRQATRDSHRRKREIEREAKAQQRRSEQAIRATARADAQALKDEFQIAKVCFDDRAEERRLVKEDIINEYMR